MLLVVSLFGSFHAVCTVTGIFECVLNFKYIEMLVEDPTGRIALTGSLSICIEITIQKMKFNNAIKCLVIQ